MTKTKSELVKKATKSTRQQSYIAAYKLKEVGLQLQNVLMLWGAGRV